MNAFIKFGHALTDVFKFHGGVHPPENKTQSTQLPISPLPMPAMLTLPLRQHVGQLPKLLVTVGDHVSKGQLLAEPEGTVSAAIHAPTSGTIVAIEPAVIPHPSGLPDMCIRLQPDGKDIWIAHQGVDWSTQPADALINMLRTSGIVGMGGATFPTQIKLNTPGQTNIHTLVINAAECEPYITCDDMLMRERASGIVEGIRIAQYLMRAETVVIGIEDNKPEAIAALQQAVIGTDIMVKVVPTLYPSGDARRLVYLLLGKEIAHDKRATQEGIQVFNVATMLALHRFFDHGEPAINRIVSMTGNVSQPRNFEVLFGTSIADLAAAAGGAKPDTSHFIMGGPMMGFDLPNALVPITKASNCIIAAAPAMFPPAPEAMPCIRCARCADACPVTLQPQELYWFAKSDNFDKARDYQLFDCIECGACSYVCPSHIPLVQYYRYAKSEIIAIDKAKEAADLARERNEARIARIEREKQERAQKHAERAQAQQQQSAATGAQAPNPELDAAKKAAIAAAMARAKAQKEQLANDGTTDTAHAPLSERVQQKMAEVDTRRAAMERTKAESVTAAPTVGKDDDAEKQAKIAAAIAKAKAAKAAQLQSSKTTQVREAQNAVDEGADKQAHIAAAIARAKAAKQAADALKAAPITEIQASDQAHTATTDTATDAPVLTSSADSDKQAKIAAAIARAKAAKAAAQSQRTDQGAS